MPSVSLILTILHSIAESNKSDGNSVTPFGLTYPIYAFAVWRSQTFLCDGDWDGGKRQDQDQQGKQADKNASRSEFILIH